MYIGGPLCTIYYVLLPTLLISMVTINYYKLMTCMESNNEVLLKVC